MAGASAWARYRTLSSRVERCAVGSALGAAAGVMTAGFVDWRIGACSGAGVAALHYGLSYLVPGPETEWRRGARAERRTGRDLGGLGRGYAVLHDRTVPYLSATNLDHLVVGLTGVYVVITRRVRRGVRLWADEGRLWAGEEPVGGIGETAARAAELVSRFLAEELDEEVGVVPLVAVQSGKVEPEGLEHEGVTFHRGREIPEFVKAHPVIFTSAQVTAIAAAADRLFPPMRLQF
ncbi:NERD domain-containing protein [Actinocorallia sp. API 0066]|uniref:nuclease-related domain-containing protein n=1 Tax=Actinocorallia sp. API 0066 TaxID=2896846 RepID=UPI001E2A0536|nr:nuclease-related domain-containing protein [Actinocorallia sp. API 0066]MCD0452304.1 NERD domain-containing protein [Actinocorallia sp. API 0066]